MFGTDRGRGDTTSPDFTELHAAEQQQLWNNWKDSLPVSRAARKLLYKQQNAIEPVDTNDFFSAGVGIKNPQQTLKRTLTNTLLGFRAPQLDSTNQMLLDGEEVSEFMLHCFRLLTAPPPETPTSMRANMNLQRPDGSYTDPEQGHVLFGANKQTGLPQLTLIAAATVTKIDLNPFELQALNGWLTEHTVAPDPEF